MHTSGYVKFDITGNVGICSSYARFDISRRLFYPTLAIFSFGRCCNNVAAKKAMNGRCHDHNSGTLRRTGSVHADD